MKTFIKIAVWVVMVGALMVPGLSWANEPVDPGTDPYGVAQTAGQAGLPETVAGAYSIGSAVGNIVSSVLALIGILFFILILYAGFTWMTARGDSGKIDKAKSVLEDAVIGMLLVSAAYAIANFMFGTVVGGGKCAAMGGQCMTKPACDASKGIQAPTDSSTETICPTPAAGKSGQIICCVPKS